MATIEVVVVYDQKEYAVDAQVDETIATNNTSTNDDDVALSLELLQFQLFSLVGVAPEGQIFLSSRGTLVVAGATQPQQQPQLVVSRLDRRPRLFLLTHDSTATTSASSPLPSDWPDICSRSVFGTVPVVQPAFTTSSADDVASILCRACAQTCTTAARAIEPREWLESNALHTQFISALTIVSGSVDVAPPRGFSKLPGDLNYGGNGRHLFLCVQRSGVRALTHICVDSDARNVQLQTESVFMKTLDVHETLAITDVVVVSGKVQHAPSRQHIQLPQRLNAFALAGGDADSAAPVHLWYKLAPIGGFVCSSGAQNGSNDGHHSDGNACLFALRHDRTLCALWDVPANRVEVAARVSIERRRSDDAALQTAFAYGEQTMAARLRNTLTRVQLYEQLALQAAARQQIPVDTLYARARANATPETSLDDEVLAQLLHWFKREFFTWTNAPPCASCGCRATQCVGTESPNAPHEVAGEADRVEVYTCPQCPTRTRFPRYNNPLTLLTTRTGRCGEWANCFTLCCRAMGFDARYVLDVTDHVWTEVYSTHQQRWLHCDSCEDALDQPLTYEVGWGKTLSYIFAIGRDHVVDVARRYTQNWDAMRARRTDVRESWLAATIKQMNVALERNVAPARVATLHERAAIERLEFVLGRVATAAEVHGRVSGSAEWKSQRSEDGRHRDVAALMAADAASDAMNVARATTIDSNTDSVVELSQRLCKQLLLGCDAATCTNPLCLRGGSSSSTTSDDDNASATDRAAHALQRVALLNQRGVSAESLASLLCPLDTHEVRTHVLAQQPLLFLPLQDSVSSGNEWLVDASGCDRHVANTTHCPVRKPFEIAGRHDESFGLQLLPHCKLAARFLLPKASGAYAVAFFLRLDAQLAGNAADASNDDASDVLTLALGAHSRVVLRVLSQAASLPDSVVCELHDTRATPSTTVLATANVAPSLLALGAYTHVGVAHTRTSLTVFLNGVNVIAATRTTYIDAAASGDPSSGSEALVLRGSTSNSVKPVAIAVISHVSVVALEDNADDSTASDATDRFAAFCATMKQRFVRAPPLLAISADGATSDQHCDVDAARAQLSYRVAQVQLWGSENFDGVRFVYQAVTDSSSSASDALVLGPLIGNARAVDTATSPTVQLTLLEHEVVTAVSGCKGAWTDSIRLETSFGRAVTCGGSGGGAFRLSLPSGSEVRALTFGVGDHLVNPIAFVGSETASARATSDKNHLEALCSALCGSDATQSRAAIAAALKYLTNLVAQPHEPKFQRILATNAFFTKSIAALGADACIAFMHWCGFAPREMDGKSFYVLVAPSVSPSDERSADATPTATERLVAETSRRIQTLQRFSSA